MANRYLITGVQLEMLVNINMSAKEKQEMMYDIVSKQYVGNSIKDVRDDAKFLSRILSQ